MKRKLRILVALVMSLTMMFGMSTTAFADAWSKETEYGTLVNDNVECDCNHYVYVGNDTYVEIVWCYMPRAYVKDENGMICLSALSHVSALENPILYAVYGSDGSDFLQPECSCRFIPKSAGNDPEKPSVEPKDETPSMTAEEIAEQRAEAEQKAVEEKIAEEKALPVTEFTSESAVNSMPAAAKSTGASANLSKITTMQGFSSAVTKLAASAKASITNRNGVASVTVYTDRPMTFSTDMLDAIYATDINFEYVFRYEGKLYKITIPRGVKVDLGESRYEGPLCVGKILGTTQVIE